MEAYLGLVGSPCVEHPEVVHGVVMMRRVWPWVRAGAREPQRSTASPAVTVDAVPSSPVSDVNPSAPGAAEADEPGSQLPDGRPPLIGRGNEPQCLARASSVKGSGLSRAPRKAAEPTASAAVNAAVAHVPPPSVRSTAPRRLGVGKELHGSSVVKFGGVDLVALRPLGIANGRRRHGGSIRATIREQTGLPVVGHPVKERSLYWTDTTGSSCQR